MQHPSDHKHCKIPTLKAFLIKQSTRSCVSEASIKVAIYSRCRSYRGSPQLTLLSSFNLCCPPTPFQTTPASSPAGTFDYRLYCSSVLVHLLSSVCFVVTSQISFLEFTLCPLKTRWATWVIMQNTVVQRSNDAPLCLLGVQITCVLLWSCGLSCSVW